MITIDPFRSVSIRGRMAFGIHCLEAAFRQYHYDRDLTDPDPDLLNDLVIPRLHSFVEVEQMLDEWDGLIGEVSPLFLMDERGVEDFSICQTIDEEQAWDLSSEYAVMPPALRDLITWVMRIGSAELYSTIQADSAATLEAIAEVARLMGELAVPLPPTAPYQISPFSEERGWGKVRPMRDFGPGY